MTTRRQFVALGAAAALAPRPGWAQGALEALPFSSLRPGEQLPGWLKPYTFDSQPRHTEYALVEDGGRTVLRARSNASASGLIRELRVDPATHPVLAWRWKVMNLIGKGDLASKAGDDFPARLYVSFALEPSTLSVGERMRIELARMRFGPNVPVAVLCYVWDGKAPSGSFAPSAYTDRVRMVVVESGGARLGQWVSHERDVAEDFKRAFGVAAPVVNGVIVSSDSDNTGEAAEAYFGDAHFTPRRPS